MDIANSFDLKIKSKKVMTCDWSTWDIDVRKKC